jgi:uncharacterized protein
LSPSTKDYKVVNTRTGQVIASNARLAADIKSRSVGLLGKKEIGPDEALIIRPCSSIHTLFMRFKIDVIFIAKDGTVRKIIHSMPTWRFAASRGARDTIELSSGSLLAHDILVGDVLEIHPVATP